MSAHLFELKKTAFVLWRPGRTDTPPRLVIGEFAAGNPATLGERRVLPLRNSPELRDLWILKATECGLQDGRVYHYWFEVEDTNPGRDGRTITCTDPTAFTVDWRLLADALPSPYGVRDQDPAAVVKFERGQLLCCDPGGELPKPAPPIAPALAAANNQLVIYELPTSWTRINVQGDPQAGVGTFRDVRALIAPDACAANFAGCAALRAGRSHLLELGVNALELLPIADSFVEREWGYATSNYFAPDHELGFPSGHTSPTANTDLADLVGVCHEHGIRFFIDVVMAFATQAPMENVNFAEFHIDARVSSQESEAFQSGGQGLREGFGGSLLRYGQQSVGYDPLKGERRPIFAARQWMKAYLLRWMSDFAIDGVRMDSVNNVANWDFVQEFKDLARAVWQRKGGAAEKFLVVGEELSVPLALVEQQRLDGLWNERFKHLVRRAVLGRNHESEPSFEWTVRKLIDCRLLGFSDGAQAVNYVGSHDVEGFGNERLFNFLQNNGVAQTEERIKLAFACLLTAVGVPMIFAGDEFADTHDLSVNHPPKQRDAVNYDRLQQPFRRRVFDYVARLVRLRTQHPALAVNDTDFIHTDFEDGKRVLVWRRGGDAMDPVVVVANFSDFASEGFALGAAAEYRVPGWPKTPPGRSWREVTQARDVPAEWIGREPIFPWEAKVYTLA